MEEKPPGDEVKMKRIRSKAGPIAIQRGARAEARAMERILQITGTAYTGTTLEEEEEQKKKDDANVMRSTETMQLDQIQDPMRDAMLADFERRRRARQLTLPTDELEVKLMLRQLGQPICLFGEDKPDRRERLRLILSQMDEEDAQAILHKEEPRQQPQRKDDQTWYHEGPDSLRVARVFIAKYSLPRSVRRLELARHLQDSKDLSTDRAVRQQEAHKHVRSLAPYGSQIGDNRPVVFCEFNPTSQYLATASWSGLCKLWSVPECRQLRTFRGHSINAACIKFHPDSGRSLSEDAVNLASCAHDGTVYLWTLNSDEPLSELEGHPARVSRLSFHPSGRFLATCCHDNSWRLFDLEANEEVLFQEGHSRAVYDIDFQTDGSLACTGGMDGYGRVWDLRTGRCIMFMEGHQKEVLSVAWARNGFQMATGSADNSVKMWDVRARKCIYTIPAHTSLVSRVCFDQQHGHYLMSSSYDNTIKLWTHPGWQPLKVLSGHDSKVMSVHASNDGKWICSSGYDRTFKLWTSDRPPSSGVKSTVDSVVEEKMDATDIPAAS